MFGRLAPTLLENGYAPLPIRPDTKVPAVGGWNRRASAARFERWCQEHAESGVGLLCGDVVGIDIDVLDHEAAAGIEALVVGELGPTPLLRVGQWPKRLLIYRLTEPMRSRSMKMPGIGGMDLLAMDRQFVAFGKHPATGRRYEWPNENTPIDTPKDALPSVSPHQIKTLTQEVLSRCSMEYKAQAPYHREQASNIGLKSPSTGLIVDCRDEHLRALVFEAWRRRPTASPDQIARTAWAQFSATADTQELKHNGAGPGRWSYADALQKARYLVNKATRNAVKRVSKARLRPHAAREDLKNENKEAFCRHCQALHQAGQITAIQLRVSTCMLDRIKQGRCTDSVDYLAGILEVSPKTVQRARRELLRLGLWSTGRKLGHCVSDVLRRRP